MSKTRQIKKKPIVEDALRLKDKPMRKATNDESMVTNLATEKLVSPVTTQTRYAPQPTDKEG